MIKNPTTIYFWWSSSYVYGVDFVKWVVCKNNSGREDTNKLGVGVLVESTWLFDKILMNDIPHGCKRGQCILRPYTDLYRSYRDAYWKRGKIRVPSVEEVRKYNANNTDT